MIPILDFQRRSVNGPVMKADEFDLSVARKMRLLVKKYEIKYNPEELIVDDATADKVFQAAVEYLADVGLYNIDTYRLVQLTREEVEEIARDYRENQRKQVFGRGKEQICIQYRTGQDPNLPVLMMGGTGGSGNIAEEWHIPYYQSLAQEEMNHGLGYAGGISAVDGLAPKSGTLSEIHCGLWEQKALLEALRRAGREGMHLGVLQSVYTFGGVAAVVKQGLRDPSNTQLGIHIMPEQKIDWTRLLTAYFAEENGFTPWTSAISILGGLCGGPPGTAVGLVANLLSQLAYGHGTVGSMVTTHMDGQGGTREALWVYSAAARASERNIKVPTGGIASANGLLRGTAAAAYQQAASTVVSTCSGVAYIWSGCHMSLDVRLCGAVIRAAAGMERDKANTLVNAIMKKNDEALLHEATPTKYKQFPELYDVKTLKPKPEYTAAFTNATEEMARLGLPVSSHLKFD